MSLLKKNTSKKSSKHPCNSSDSFRNDNASIAFLDHYKRAPIILERSVDLLSLKETFILEVFKERTWTKLLNPMGDVFEDIIREFFTNASISKELIQEILEIQLTTLDTFVEYDERKEKLEPLVEVLGGQLNKKALHTIEFTLKCEPWPTL